MLTWWFQSLGLFGIVSVFLKALFVKELEIDSIIQLVGLMATIAGVFIGVEGVRDIRAAGIPTRKTVSYEEEEIPIDEELEEEEGI